MEAIALSGVTDWAPWREGEGERLKLLESKSLNGSNSRDFFEFFAGDGFDISIFRYQIVRGDGVRDKSHL